MDDPVAKGTGLFVPALSGVYSSLHNFVETLLRVVAGVAW
jgi:hypothetical protein